MQLEKDRRKIILVGTNVEGGGGGEGESVERNPNIYLWIKNTCNKRCLFIGLVFFFSLFFFENQIPEREFLLRVSYMEIYNETITDLLCDIRKKKPLGIREDVNVSGCYVV